MGVAAQTTGRKAAKEMRAGGVRVGLYHRVLYPEVSQPFPRKVLQRGNVCCFRLRGLKVHGLDEEGVYLKHCQV